MSIFAAGEGRAISYSVHEAVGDVHATVLLVHGYGYNKHQWDGYAALFPSSYRIVAIDCYSHGESSDVRPDHLDDEDLETARDAIALMVHLKSEKYAVVGHSYGGRVAGLIAGLDRTHVEAAILITPVPIVGMPEEQTSAMIPPMKLALQSADLNVFRGLMAAMNASPTRTGGRPFRADFEAMRKAFRRCLLHPDFPERIRYSNKDRTAIISTITAPVLLLSCDEDFVFSGTVADRKVLPHAQYHCFGGTGHLFPMTDPAGTVAVLQPFIERSLSK